MNYTKLPKKVLLLLATPVLFSLAVPAGKLVAQSQTETKIRLMAEGLRARDNGDLAAAKANFEQLLVLAPNDVTVQRLLTGVNNSLSAGAAVPAVAPVADVVSEPVEVVYNPNAKPAVVVPVAAPVPVPVQSSSPAPVVIEAPVDRAGELAKAEEMRVRELIVAAEGESKAAAELAAKGDYDAAGARYEAASRSLPLNTVTAETIQKLDAARNELYLNKSQALLKQGNVDGARQALDAYIAATSPEGKAARKQAQNINNAELNPPIQPIDKVSPGFHAEQKNLATMLAKGRSQYVAGDIDGAQETFNLVETASAGNSEAKYFLTRIADEKSKLGTLNREKTRSLMMEEVAKGWQRPGVFKERGDHPVNPVEADADAMNRKLDSIVIPNFSFPSSIELGRVISTLSALSEEYDKTSAEGQKGVNLVLGNPLSGVPVPQVNSLTLRGMTLRQILDVVADIVGYQVDVQSNLVKLKPSGADVNLINDQFAVSKSAILRMTGSGAASATTPSTNADPFAPAPTGTTAPSGGGESDGIRRFLQAAGVPFDTVPGSSLAYDGASILVTHTARNIDRIRNILSRYNDVRQVEIEAKFMDVNEGALDELGITWTANARGLPLISNVATGETVKDTSGQPVIGNYKTKLGTQNRSLNSAFTSSSSVNGGQIVANGTSIDISNSPPSLPGTVGLAGSAQALATITGAIGEFDVSATLRALSQRTGSDLLSAPKVTVLSGNRANMTVAQELRFPQSYGETQSEVGTAGGTNGGGSAGVTITPGTPEDFTTRNVGVELAVTPTVEEDDYSISLELNPRVTEFEGFVEYGGSSVAISGGTTVVTPSGFFQPIFSVREINTRVTLWDGATLVMGGLTREEVKRVNDKVPILGDIPFLGRAFRSKGESSQKRNLLIFVTANLVSPGGSLKKQDLRGVPASSTFQNPTLVTPSGPESRVRGN